MFKIITISFSLKKGGAGIAANKFLNLLINYKQKPGIDVYSITQEFSGKYQFFKRLLSFIFVKFQFNSNPVKHSLNLFSFSPVVESFKTQYQTIHHLHWINNDTLSIFDFDKIPSRSIITMHDEWLYCGAEHCYDLNDSKLDFVDGYSLVKKGVYGIHWNYIIWCIKKNKLKNRTDLIFTAPSKWLYNRATSSQILQKMNVRFLPNPIDTKLFYPSAEKLIKRFLNSNSFGKDNFILTFGAIRGKSNYLKGSHLLEEALKILSKIMCKEEVSRVKLLLFGGRKSHGKICGFEFLDLGHIDNPENLSLVYSSSDCVVVPSMVESFGQVAAEALSCATPVICFETSGLKDIVINNFSGFLAEPFFAESLASKIFDMINMEKSQRKIMGINGRNYILENFSFSVVSKIYNNIINEAKLIKIKSS